MPVAAPGRWVKGEAKSLLGGTRPRTPAPGESARVAENAGTKDAEYRSTPPVARHDGDRRGSPWFSWRAIALGCVLGALAVLAVLRAFPSVAAAVVPTPGPAVAAPREAGPSASLAVEPSAKAESFADIVRAHHAKHLEDAKASSGRRRAASDSKLGTHAETDERPVGLPGRVEDLETELREPTVGGEDSAARRRRRRRVTQNADARETKRISENESRDDARHGTSAAPRRAASVGSHERSRTKRRESSHESSRAREKKTNARESSAEPRSPSARLETYVSAALGDAAVSDDDGSGSFFASARESSAGGAWRSGLERNARPAFGDAAKGAPASRPAASLGAVAAAEAAARGEASGADVGDALVGDVQDSAASALRFEAGLGRQARETRRDVEGEAFLAQRRAEAQSVDPAGDALAHAREGVAQMREEHEGILAAGDDESPAARGNSGILGGDPESNAEAVANDPLVRSVFGMGVDA